MASAPGSALGNASSKGTPGLGFMLERKRRAFSLRICACAYVHRRACVGDGRQAQAGAKTCATGSTCA